MTVRHFLDLDQLDAATLRHVLDLGVRYREGERHLPERPLEGKILAMIFESPSTRTRVSFDVAMRHLGGESVLLNGSDMQLGRGESVADTARALSRYVDVILLRAREHATLLELARFADVPVINGLTRATHPCQLMADVMTFEAHRGPIAQRRVAWVGDGNNVATSWIHAAARFGFELRLACPAALKPAAGVMEWAAREGATVSLMTEPDEAVAGADCVVTDTWVSIGDQASEDRHNLLTPYRVDKRLMDLAGRDAIFMHCLPAHRGEEVTATVIDGPRSVVWDEAENRLHAQKGILTWCLG